MTEISQDFVVRSPWWSLFPAVRVHIAPLQKAGPLAAHVLAKKDLDKAIADRAQWRADERRSCREGKLSRPGWWPL